MAPARGGCRELAPEATEDLPPASNQRLRFARLQGRLHDRPWGGARGATPSPEDGTLMRMSFTQESLPVRN